MEIQRNCCECCKNEALALVLLVLNVFSDISCNLHSKKHEIIQQSKF